MGYELMTAATSTTTQSVWSNVPVLLLGQTLTIHVTVHLDDMDTTVKTVSSLCACVLLFSILHVYSLPQLLCVMLLNWGHLKMGMCHLLLLHLIRWPPIHALLGII